jgi:hypothetical protein
MQRKAAFTSGDLAEGALIQVTIMTFTFRPAPENISAALLRLRRDVLLNNFTLTKHCSMRMEQRAIDLPRIIECIREGSVPTPCSSCWGGSMTGPVSSAVGVTRAGAGSPPS